MDCYSSDEEEVDLGSAERRRHVPHYSGDVDITTKGGGNIGIR